MPAWEENKNEGIKISEGIQIGRMNTAAGHKSAQKEENPKGVATGEI